MNITFEQLEQQKNSLTLTEAEIVLHERELLAWKRRGEAERQLYTFIVDVSADPGVSRLPLRMFVDAHKAHYQVEAELKELKLARLRSQAAITKAFITEAEKVIKEPRPSGLISN